jgi:hypothetical protein
MRGLPIGLHGMAVAFTAAADVPCKLIQVGVRDMQKRASTLIAAVVLIGSALIPLRASHAQSAAAAHPVAVRALQLELRSRERVQRWAAAIPRIRCVPAPLTEHPTAAAEFARPRVAPLEASFFDAAMVKRTFASRAGSAAHPN